MTDVARYAFVSFASADLDKARAVCRHLEEAGVTCWISARDVAPGSNFQAGIVDAIQASRTLVLVFSSHTNHSLEIQKELALAGALKLAVLPVRIADARPEGALLYEMATRQWIDAFDDWEDGMDRLTQAVRDQLADAPKALDHAEAPPAAASLDLAQDTLERARRELAFFIGPIADLFVRRAKAEATSRTDFVERLAAHIQDEAERKAFRQRVGDGSQDAAPAS